MCVVVSVDWWTMLLSARVLCTGMHGWGWPGRECQKGVTTGSVGEPVPPAEPMDGVGTNRKQAVNFAISTISAVRPQQLLPSSSGAGADL
jgi:hypothetical protein